MTGQSRGTDKLKVKILPVHLGILVLFSERCLLFSVRADSHDTKSQFSH